MLFCKLDLECNMFVSIIVIIVPNKEGIKKDELNNP